MRLFFSFVLVAAGFGSGAAQQPDPCLAEGQLRALVERGRATDTEGLVLIHDGRVLVDTTYGRPRKPVYIASAGKSLTSLAVGRLLQLGQLDSLSQPVASLFPEWRQGRKAAITIRDLLAHTSGLQDNPNASIELEPPPNWRVPDIVKLALAAELTESPGTAWRYNNKAVALLGGIIERASGLRMDEFFQREFFEPMGVTSYDWIRDESGQPTAHGAFLLTARDLARFGELMLARGVYHGRRYVAEAWVDSSFAQAQPFQARTGLLWWRLPSWTRYSIQGSHLDTLRARGVATELMLKLEPLRDRTFEDRAAYEAAMRKALGPDFQAQLNAALLPLDLTLARRTYSDRAVAYYADGYRGNFLVIVPAANLVAARVRGPGEDFDHPADVFGDFVEQVVALSARCESPD